MKIYVANNAKLKKREHKWMGLFQSFPSDHTKMSDEKKKKKKQLNSDSNVNHITYAVMKRYLSQAYPDIIHFLFGSSTFKAFCWVE